MEEKFEWSGTISAPQEYPVEIYNGKIMSNDGIFEFNSMWGTINNGWGNEGKIKLNGEFEIPYHIEFTWFSIIEQKFYSGQGTLPKQKIFDYFNEGYTYNGIKQTYDKLVIGLAPTGLLIVWLSGENQVEVARYIAEEKKISIKNIHSKDLYMFKKDFANRILTDENIITSNIKNKIDSIKKVSFKIFDEYREKYLWKPKIILPENTTLVSLYIKMCNGEKENYYFDEILFKESRAIPYSFEIVWIDINEQEYISRIVLTKDSNYWNDYLENGKSALPLDFEENKIRSIFKKLEPNVFSELVIKIDDKQEKNNQWVIDFYLMQEKNKYHIKEINQDSGQY